MTLALPHIARMSPYALAEMAAPPGKELISLSQNESLRPPSPRAIAAAQRVAGHGALYPDPDWTDLRSALAALHGLPADRILCGNGSLDLIGCLARAFSGPGRAVLAPAHAYPFFRTAAQIANARFDTAPETDLTADVDSLLAQVRPDTGVVFVANPGNPTGTRVAKAELERLRAGLHPDILLVIDEAYGEFADHLGEPAFDLVETGLTVVLRTFSKAYGMAGFRVGWGVFPPSVARELRKVMNPNNVSMVSQAAALAALEDQAYMRETCAQTTALREAAALRLRQAGFAVPGSLTNFLLLDFETPAKGLAATRALEAEGLFLRPQGGAGLPHMLRMTIGPEDALNAALDRLEHWKRETPA